MSPQHPIIWVLSKELREILRDKRVRTGAIFTPIFVVLMMVGLFGVISQSLGKGSKQKVTLVRSSNSITTALNQNPGLKVTEISNLDEGRKLIQDAKANLVVEVVPESTDHYQVKLYFDPKEDQAQIGIAAVKRTLDAYSVHYQEETLKAKNLSLAEITPISYKEQPIKVGEGAGAGSIIVSILPYMMVLFTFTGGFSIAADMVAGEKEKNTLETLLITPVHRIQIVLGKFFAIGAVCLASAFSSVAGLLIASALHLPGSDIMFEGGLGLSVNSCLAIVATLLPLVALFAGLMVSVSSYARNSREAQTMLSILNLGVLIPAVLSQGIGFTDFAHSIWINFIPVLGSAMNIRAAFQGKASWLFVGESVLTGTILAAIALFVAVRLFLREQVLVRV